MSASGPNADSPELPSEHDPYSALRIADYRFLIGSQLMIVIGGQIQAVAAGWELYGRTNSMMAMGWIGLVQFLPVIALTPIAGHAADRFDRRIIMLLTLITSGLCAAGMALVSHYHAPVGWMYACLMLRSISQTFGRPARSALMPQIVPAAIFTNAVTWGSTTFQLAFMIGPAIGGMIIQRSLPLAYVCDAICALIGFVLACCIKPRPKRTAVSEPVTLANLAAGLHFVASTKVMLAALTLDLFAVLLGGATGLFPVYAKDILKVNGGGMGWLRSAPAAGSCVMALILAHLPPLKRSGRALLFMVAGFGLATIGFGLSRSFTLSLLMLFLAGAFDNVSVVIRHTLVQMLTPDAMRGRVSAVNGVFIGASNQLGDFESAAVASAFEGRGFERVTSATISVVSGGIGTLLVVLGVSATWPQLRRVGALHEIKPVEVPLEAAVVVDTAEKIT